MLALRQKPNIIEAVNKYKIWLLAGGAAILAVLGTAAIISLDSAGWIPHRRKTEVYVGSAPWDGKSMRKCAALPDQKGRIIFLGCVAGPEDFRTPKQWTVTYWGKIRRPDRFEKLTTSFNMEGWKWRCQQNGDSLTCWAVN